MLAVYYIHLRNLQLITNMRLNTVWTCEPGQVHTQVIVVYKCEM
jgi:hypothetical protein